MSVGHHKATSVLLLAPTYNKIFSLVFIQGKDHDRLVFVELSAPDQIIYAFTNTKMGICYYGTAVVYTLVIPT